jgi:hypothetical protein
VGNDPKIPRQCARALADPAQRRLWITSSTRLDQLVQRRQQTWITYRDTPPAGASAPNSPRLQQHAVPNLPDPAGNRLPGPSARSLDRRHTAVGQRHSPRCSHQAPRTPPSTGGNRGRGSDRYCEESSIGMYRNRQEQGRLSKSSSTARPPGTREASKEPIGNSRTRPAVFCLLPVQ